MAPVQFITTHQRSCGKVISCLSVHRWKGIPCDNYPWYIEPHCTGSPTSPLPDMGPHCTGSPTSPLPNMGPHSTGTPSPVLPLDMGPHYRDHPGPHWHWHLVTIDAGTVGASRLYPSYGNAFLLSGISHEICLKQDLLDNFKVILVFVQIWHFCTKLTSGGIERFQQKI